MKKFLAPILLLFMLIFMSLPISGAEQEQENQQNQGTSEYETLRLKKEDIQNKLNGNTVTFKMMDSERTSKKLEINEDALKYMSEKGIKLTVDTTIMSFTMGAEACKTKEWLEAVKSGEPLSIRFLIKKGSGSKVSEHFDEWYYNQIGLSRISTSAWDLSGEILVGGVGKYDISSFAIPINIKIKYPVDAVNSVADASKLEMYVLNEPKEKWDYLGGTVDREERIISFNTKAPGLFIILSNQKPAQFSDIKGHWAEGDITYMMQKNVIQLSGESKFFPDRDTTRGEFAAFLARTLGLTSNSQVKKFADVSTKIPYFQEITAAANSGIVLGTTDGKFLPNAKITRQEIAVMLDRALKYGGIDTPLTQNVLNKFSDRKKISSWAVASSSIVVKSGIMSGRQRDIFAPLEFTSRAEAIVLLHRLSQKISD